MSNHIWVKFWRSRRTGRNTETYRHINPSLYGHDKEEFEDFMMDEAGDWASDCGPNGYEFRYGFEVVDRPPDEWIDKEMDYLMRRIDGLTSDLAVLVELKGQTSSGEET